ncbi:MAG: DUF2807 domain-containing protein [Crocinitomicaceae bacterium]|nr:DUF2807 domain-containing protein [Crocinitomicaceae bacterium]
MRYLLPFLILMLLACDKPEDRSCFKWVGDITTKEISLESFDKLYMGPHLKYILVQDTEEKVILHGGANLLNFIETSIDDDNRLNIRNNNECSFLRDYDKMVTVEIHVKKITNIMFEGSERVDCQNQLITDYMTLTITDGVGEFKLNVDAIALHTIVTHGWGNFTLYGETDYLNMEVRSNGWGNAYNMLIHDSLHVISKSTETLKINPGGCALKAQVHSEGSIWYIGTPTSIEYIKTGGGELVDKN